MGVVSEVFGNDAAPHVIEYNGRRYPMRLIDQIVKSAFEKARFVKAKEALELIKDTLTPEEYAGRLKEKTDLYEAGEYEIFSESGMAFIQTIAGMRLLLSLVIDCSANELMGLVLAKKDEIVPMLGLILRESFPGLQMEAHQQEFRQEAVNTAKKNFAAIKAELQPSESVPNG